MFFSQNTWEDSANGIIPTSYALSFDKVMPSLISVDEIFLRPLIGETLIQQAVEIFNKQEEQRTDVEKELLRQLQVATLNLALFYDFHELNVRITDQGFQRQQTENFAQTYKYQEDALIRNFRNKGFNALDRILDIYDDNTEAFPAYTTSPAYTDTRKRIVQSAREVSEIYYIGNSRIIFLRLLPILREIEETALPIILGEDICCELRQAIAEDNEQQTIGNTTFAELRHRCVQYLVFKACAQLIRQTGNLTDRGLYFTSMSASGEGNENITPAGTGQAARLAMNMEQSAAAYSAALTTFIQFYIPELFKGHENDVFKRDNDRKRTVWL